jgi:uncharacterized protein YutE (UPF0331/DUF86 family)
MTKVLKSQSIVPRIDGIMRDLERLEAFGKMSIEEFGSNIDNFYLAQFHLRQALEGIFHISEHILSRLNGTRATEYKEVARKLGEYKVLSYDFANHNLVQMAGYRNRLTHFYAEVTQEEMYRIITEDLGDFEVFIRSIKEFLENLKEFGLEME